MFCYLSENNGNHFVYDTSCWCRNVKGFPENDNRQRVLVVIEISYRGEPSMTIAWHPFATVCGTEGRLFGTIACANSVHPGPQGLMTPMPQPSKSFKLRVATTAPVELAIAAIWQSASMIGLPDARRAAAISA